ATVVVKQAVGRQAAQSVAPAVACRMIREGVTAALKRRRRPFVLSSPVTIEVDFALTSHADVAELCPGARLPRSDAKFGSIGVTLTMVVPATKWARARVAPAG